MHALTRRAVVAVAVAGAAAFATGCGNYEVRPVASPSKIGTTAATTGGSNGSVCVARLEDDVAGAPVPVWDNAILVGASTRGSHYCWAAEPGRHYLMSELLVTTELVVDVRAGATTWVVMETDTSLMHSGIGSRGYRAGRRRESVRLIFADEAKGEQLRAATAQIELFDVPADQRPPPRSPIPAAR